MEWKTLFSTHRLNDSGKAGDGPHRSHYEKDFDRVVFSTAFRRLQDKTQVVPLPEHDFVHSRLTHSLEASCVGRSLGRMVGEKVVEKYGPFDNVSLSDFGSVVAAACLAHDIGNPPFGHSGEAAISSYFTCGKGEVWKDKINDDKKWCDLTNFEGNANGFRLLTNTKSSTGGGIQLTVTTLAAFTKYPCESLKPDKTFKQRASQSKYGFFQVERDLFDKIFSDLSIRKLRDGSWCRHPLAFLVEASDDICYRIIDFEDGVRAGLVDFRTAEAILRSIVPATDLSPGRYDLIREDREKLGYLRAKVINQLILEVVDEFWSHEEEILAGDYDFHLAERINSAGKLDEIETLSTSNIYKSKSVLQIEVAGFSIVAELLDSFIIAVNDLFEYGKDVRKSRPFSSKLINFLPAQFLGPDEKPEDDLYLRILQICEFVAGMTDTYAMTLYRRLKGIELPLG